MDTQSIRARPALLLASLLSVQVALACSDHPSDHQGGPADSGVTGSSGAQAQAGHGGEGTAAAGRGGASSAAAGRDGAAGRASQAGSDGQAGSAGTSPPGSVKPDTGIDPIADCSGAPDMTLCNVETTPDRWYDICVDGRCVSPGCGMPECNAPGPHFPIPPFTGHTALQLESGAEPVTIDLVTGLHWQSCAGGLSGEACEQGTALEPTWADALAYCDGLSWAGKDDWYLPDIHELVSILDAATNNGGGGILDPALFPNSRGAREFYWSSTYESTFWVSSVNIGFPLATQLAPESTFGAVRCVRRGFSTAVDYTDERFTVSNFGGPSDHRVIEDGATTLQWQGCNPREIRCEDGFPMLVYAEAKAYCEQLELGGFSDWRLPSYKELHSIVLYRSAYASAVGFDQTTFGGPFGAQNALRLLDDGNALDPDDGGFVASGGQEYPFRCVRAP